MKHDAQYGRTLHSDFFGDDNGRLKAFDDGIHAKAIAWNFPFRVSLNQAILQFAAVILLQGVSRKAEKPFI
jgi:hypothetical protein